MADFQQDQIEVWRDKLQGAVHFELQKQRLNDQQCFYFGAALADNTSLYSIKLRSDRMGVIGVQAIAEACRRHKTLIEFELHGNNGVGDEACEIIADALKENKGIQRIHLCSFGIGRNGADAISTALRFSHSIKLLDLERNNLRYDGCLSLSNALAGNLVLTELSLINNNIGDSGAEVMSEVLITNKSLEILYLQQNQIGDKGVQSIADALTKNSKLTKLGLGNNPNISPKGYLAMANGLKDNSSLAWLSGIDLMAHAHEIFGLSNKQIEKIINEKDVNNAVFLREADVTREMTRIRYENLTQKYKKNINSRSSARRALTCSRGPSNSRSEKGADHSSSKRTLSTTSQSFLSKQLPSRARKKC